MPRRKQFQGICHDILGSFVSRYNDLGGYWALGQYVSILNRTGKRGLQFKLMGEVETIGEPAFGVSVDYYRGAVLRMMEASGMPQGWLADATITVSMAPSSQTKCEIEILSDLGRTYRWDRTISVRPHDPAVEQQRGNSFGPSNQRGTWIR